MMKQPPKGTVKLPPFKDGNGGEGLAPVTASERKEVIMDSSSKSAILLLTQKKQLIQDLHHINSAISDRAQAFDAIKANTSNPYSQTFSQEPRKRLNR